MGLGQPSFRLLPSRRCENLCAGPAAPADGYRSRRCPVFVGSHHRSMRHRLGTGPSQRRRTHRFVLVSGRRGTLPQPRAHRRRIAPHGARYEHRHRNAPIRQPAPPIDHRRGRSDGLRCGVGGDVCPAHFASPTGSTHSDPARPNRLERTLYQQVLISSPRAIRGLLLSWPSSCCPSLTYCAPRRSHTGTTHHEQCCSLHTRATVLRRPHVGDRQELPGTEHNGRQHARSVDR